MSIVQKFGGSSLADLEKLRRAASIVLEAWRRGQQPVAVVSAAGDTTDELLALARQITPKAPQRELDALLATGEQSSAALMAIMLESLGAPARSYTGWQAGIHTDAVHGAARIRLLVPETLRTALKAGCIPVVAGFQGLTPEGDISTLGRGGSDTSAVALAAALGAGRCEIYTDVDGIYTADPRLVPDARRLEEIDFRDMLALSLGGSQVLHPRSVQLAMEQELELWLLPAFRAGAGTRLALLPEERRAPVAGVTRNPEENTVTLAGRAVGPNTAAPLLDLLRHSGIPAEVKRAEEGCVSLQVAQAQLLGALRLLHDAVMDP